MEYNLATLRRDLALDMLDDEEYEPATLDRAINRLKEDKMLIIGRNIYISKRS